MKKAIIILYAIAVVQAFGTIIGFFISYKVMEMSFYEAGKELVKACDQRYVRL